MDFPPQTILVVLCLLWVLQAYLAVVAQFRLADRAKRRQTERFAAYRPHAALIVPFKGVEPALQDNLKGLFTQDYPDYRVVMVVEDEQDEAYPLLQQAMRQHPQRQVHIVTAGLADDNEGQKVHNLIAAIEFLKNLGADEEVWVFADSDAVPGAAWMTELVGPLCQERTAVTTGFRWLIPEPRPGEDKPTFAAKAASIINSSTTGFIRRERFACAWGGSMAMRVSTAQEGDLLGRWRGAISDDYQVTRMCRDLDRRIYFVPECLVASPVDYDMQGLSEFAYRQYLITRVYAPKVFYGALMVTSLYFIGMASALLLLILHDDGRFKALALGAFALVFVGNQWRANLRRSVIKSTLGPDTVRRLKSTLTLDRFATPVWLGLNLSFLLRAMFGRTITWRGIRYRLDGPQRITRL